MQISITLPSYRTINLTVKESDTIDTIKRMIQEKKNIEVDIQRIFYENDLLENEKTLEYYQVKDNATLRLDVFRTEDKTITIILSLLGGEITKIIIPPTETFLTLAAKFEIISGIPFDDQRFIFKGEDLVREISLDCYGIIDESLIHVVCRRSKGFPFH